MDEYLGTDGGVGWTDGDPGADDVRVALRGPDVDRDVSGVERGGLGVGGVQTESGVLVETGRGQGTLRTEGPSRWGCKERVRVCVGGSVLAAGVGRRVRRKTGVEGEVSGGRHGFKVQEVSRRGVWDSPSPTTSLYPHLGRRVTSVCRVRRTLPLYLVWSLGSRVGPRLLGCRSRVGPEVPPYLIHRGVSVESPLFVPPYPS